MTPYRFVSKEWLFLKQTSLTKLKLKKAKINFSYFLALKDLPCAVNYLSMQRNT